MIKNHEIIRNSIKTVLRVFWQLKISNLLKSIKLELKPR